MRKNTRFAAILFLMSIITIPAFAKRQMEALDRGLIAVSTGGSKVFLGWRLLGTDNSTTAFNIYRGTSKINDLPITGATNMIDESGSTSAKYSVQAIVNGVEQEHSKEVSVWSSNVLTINLQSPGSAWTPGDINVGDLDGDGQYELVLKFTAVNEKDNSQAGVTDNVFLHAYRLDGTCLWKIDLGPNIRAGEHYTQHQVMDYDGDGFAEVMCKTAPGTKDASGEYLKNGPAASDDDSKIYRNTDGYILSGPEYITVFNGKTGKEMATAEYADPRGAVTKANWGDDYGNRVDRFNSTTAWLDGERPSAIFQRGYYYKLTCAAWDWRDGKLTKRWFIDSRKSSGYSGMNDQGNHGIMVGDGDADGKDEVYFGASALDHDGKLLYANGLGHGDAGHIGDMDPDHKGLELWLVREGAKTGSAGSYMADGVTGKPVWQHNMIEDADVGRGCAADIDSAYPGYEMWSSATDGTYSCKGKKISSNKGSVNFRIYWDGDLQDELLDGNKIDKWTGNGTKRLLTATGSSHNGTKSTPNITADILGDWREELILCDATKLYLTTTTIPTNYRLYTLMHDPGYRAGVASEQSSYNQPPHLGFYLGAGVDNAPKPDIYLAANNATGINSNIKSHSVSPVNSAGIFRVSSVRSISVNECIVGKSDISIFDLSGHLVKKATVTNGRISLREFGITDGVYILKSELTDRTGR